MIEYFTGFYGAVGGILVIGIVLFCIVSVIGQLIKICQDRRKS